jgi:hypothetical protein
MPAKLHLSVPEIKAHYESTRLTHNAPGAYKIELIEEPSAIEAAVKAFLQTKVPPAFHEWHDVKDMPEAEQKKLWTYREWLFAQILMYVAQTYTGNPDVVLQMFGSGTPTSDIDVSVESKRASSFIEHMEKSWHMLTGDPTTKWDIEFYGDFLMFLDPEGNNNFLNSRKFNSMGDSKQDILAFVGVSILRNAGSLSFPEMDSFLAKHPDVQDQGWKAKAQQIFTTYQNMTPATREKEYYTLLRKAEELRDSLSVPGLSDEQKNAKTYEIFIALCNANIYRSENYILPSTVIHVVRDIQAKAPRPVNRVKECPLFKSKIASCPLGKFTYLCSALEQIGYMKRFEGDQKKQVKYGTRLEDAVQRIEMGQIGGRRQRRRGRKSLRRRSRRRATRRRV